MNNMFIKFINAFMFMFSVVMTISCDKEVDKINNDKSENLIPLKVNNNWTYIETGLDSLGNILYEYPITFEVLGDTILDSKSCYVTNFLSDKSNNTYTYLTDGLYRVYDYGTYIKYKYPVKNNDSFMNGLQVVYVLTGVRITVPAGEFICINYYHYNKYSNNNKEIRVNDYVCPGIGLIKSEKSMIYNNSAYIYKTYKLKEYSINK